MKKLVLVAVATFGFSFSGIAQEIKWGVKAGVNMANISVKVPGMGSTSHSETGFYLGGTAEFVLSDKIKLQPELIYVSLPKIKGASGMDLEGMERREDFDMSDLEGFGAEQNLSYINVPVLVKYEVAEKINLMAGPSFNYFMDAKEDKFKIGVDFGGSYDITENIDVNAKYTMGTGDVKVSGIFIGAGYTF